MSLLQPHHNYTMNETYLIFFLERKSRREYWVGMSIETTKGLSKIFRVEKSIQPSKF